MSKSYRDIIKAWGSMELPPDIPVRKGRNARPTVPHQNRKKELKNGYSKYKGAHTGI